jgi:hypothetical protein
MPQVRACEQLESPETTRLRALFSSGAAHSRCCAPRSCSQRSKHRATSVALTLRRGVAIPRSRRHSRSRARTSPHGPSVRTRGSALQSPAHRRHKAGPWQASPKPARHAKETAVRTRDASEHSRGAQAGRRVRGENALSASRYAGKQIVHGRSNPASRATSGVA